MQKEINLMRRQNEEQSMSFQKLMVENSNLNRIKKQQELKIKQSEHAFEDMKKKYNKVQKSFDEYFDIWYLKLIFLKLL